VADLEDRLAEPFTAALERLTQTIESGVGDDLALAVRELCALLGPAHADAVLARTTAVPSMVCAPP
jgi:hypothetical protein